MDHYPHLTDKERERQWEGNPRAVAGTHEVERRLLWLKSKSISEAHEVVGLPEPGKERRAFLSRECLLPPPAPAEDVP